MAAYEAQISAPGNGRAIVLGSGLAGLLAARVLADTFEEVMIIERHNYPVVQPVLPQMLSSSARTQLDGLFPGLSAELVADDATMAVDARLQFTQGFIHSHLAGSLESCEAVVIQHGCDAVGLLRGGGRCVGVHVLPQSRSAAARTIPADLVVDAMGAQSRLCIWVYDLWGIHVQCDQQMITQYASRLYQLRAARLPAATTIDLRPARPYRTAVMAVENGQYVVIIAGPNSPPRDSDQFDQLLRRLLPREVAAAIGGAQSAGPVIMSASAQIRRPIDYADRLPPNVVPLGDSLCSMDPLEGRGFEAAVLEASRLVRTWLRYRCPSTQNRADHTDSQRGSTDKTWFKTWCGSQRPFTFWSFW